jgi:subtilisin family serine protease
VKSKWTWFLLAGTALLVLFPIVRTTGLGGVSPQFAQALDIYIPPGAYGFWDADRPGVDLDGDGYFSAIDLSWDADYWYYGNVRVFVRIYARNAAKIERFIGQSDVYNINDAEYDVHSFRVQNLPRGEWDFRLDLYLYGSGGYSSKKVAQLGYGENPLLTDVQMERLSDETGTPVIRVTPVSVSKAPLAATGPLPHKVEAPRPASDKLTPELHQKLGAAKPNELLPLLVLMRTQLDAPAAGPKLANLSKVQRRDFVLRELKGLAATEQAGALDLISQHAARGEARRVHSLWIANAISLEGTAALAQRLAALPEVAAVSLQTRKVFPLEANSAALVAAPNPNNAWNITKVRAPGVWPTYQGRYVKVAIVDTGVNYDHYDLVNNMWHNPGEIPDNGIDDDENGYVDDYYGYNFAEDNSDPMDDYGHGSHVAGTVAGEGGTGLRTGVARQATIVAVKVLSYGGGTFADIVRGIQYATLTADVMNMSLGANMPTDDPEAVAVRKACDNAVAAGAVVVCAAGNERLSGFGISPPIQAALPGAVPSVISVGATDVNDRTAPFSSQGPSAWFDYPNPPGLLKPDISAPGVDVVSALDSGGYIAESGTSMASPHVAGAAALLLSALPALSPEAVKGILQLTSVDLGFAGRDVIYGSGRLDCYAATFAVPAMAGRIYRALTIYNDGTFPLTITSIVPSDPSWLAVFPTSSFQVPVHQSQHVVVYGNLGPGHVGSVTINSNDLVHPAVVVPVDFTSTFADVGESTFAREFIEALARAGITGGCGGLPPNYCPTQNVTRAQMAAFLIRALGETPSAAAESAFVDVPTSHPFFGFIQRIAELGITGGCRVDPDTWDAYFCPDDRVSRAQMAAFICKALHWQPLTLDDVHGQPTFADVPSYHQFFGVIEQMYKQGVTGGCLTNPLRYCPSAFVRRDEMAVFLVKAFDIPL